jgi:hypothetical protein
VRNPGKFAGLVPQSTDLGDETNAADRDRAVIARQFTLGHPS